MRENLYHQVLLINYVVCSEWLLRWFRGHRQLNYTGMKPVMVVIVSASHSTDPRIHGSVYTYSYSPDPSPNPREQGRGQTT